MRVIISPGLLKGQLIMPLTAPVKKKKAKRKVK